MTSSFGGSDLIVQGRVLGSHPSFDTAQEALEWADAEGYKTVVFEPGEYGPITPKSAQEVIGVGAGRAVFQGGTTDHGVTVSAVPVTLTNIKATTTKGQGNALDAFHITGDLATIERCRANESDRHGYYVDSENVSLIGCRDFDSELDNDGIHLTGNTVKCILAGCPSIKSVTDLGTNNNTSGHTT